MKPIHFFGLLLASLTFQAQTFSQVAAPANSSPANYVIGQQGANSRVWQKIVQTVDAQGNTIYQTNQAYVELATGLNHLVNGQYVSSTEDIEISADGSSAMATNGQHRVYFPGDIGNGVVRLITPDNLSLQSQPIGLSYFDGSSSVLIAVTTNSTGAILPSGNQVIYTNAFAGLDADLLYTYTKAGIQQDIILREQPPGPSVFGLNVQKTRLQMLTEFFTAPQAGVAATNMPTVAGNLEDDALSFGTMRMAQGNAFLLGAKSSSSPVFKRWVLINGRRFLLEEIPIESIAAELSQLPSSTVSYFHPRPPFYVTSRNLLLPAQKSKVALGRHPVQFARTAPAPRGLALDYQSYIGTQTNFTFSPDTTYYISGEFDLSGTTTIGGGTVIKYATNAFITLESGSVLNCLASQYRPVIFTAKDDNLIGARINGSTGSPSGACYANPALNFSSTATINLSYFRISWAAEAIGDYNSQINLSNGQLVWCGYGIDSIYSSMNLRNILFGNVGANFGTVFGNFDVQNATFCNSTFLSDNLVFGSLSLENCILANVGNLTNTVAGASFTGTNNGFYSCSEFGVNPVTSTNYPFQRMEGGYFYLTNGCAFFNAGTTNIDPVLLAALGTKTVYPPIFLGGLTITNDTTLGPQAQRDTGLPTLGYHYDPIDYFVAYVSITNAVLTVTNGAAIASAVGIKLQDGSSIISIGSPAHPNWFASYASVQEYPQITLGSPTVNAAAIGPVGPTGVYCFSKFAAPPNGGYIFDDAVSSSYSSLLVQNCEMWGGSSYLGGGTNTVTTLFNNLFYGLYFNANTWTSNSLSLSNNLFFGSTVFFYNSSSSNTWQAFNNAFDSCSIYYEPYVSIGWVTNGYNAYLNCHGFYGWMGELWPTNGSDIVTGASLAYQTGPFGTFYQPTNSPLIHMGSTTADQVGLYYYTVTTNEFIEGTNPVSIGYHYVALDQYGNPTDTYWLGIPDYLADPSGNSLLGTWLLEYFGHFGVDPNADPDGDGFSNLQEYQNGTDPNDYYNGHLPSLEIINGNNQNGSLGSFLPLPLTVQVSGTNSTALSNAPITLTALGNAQLTATTNGVFGTNLSLRADSNGLVSAWVYIPMDIFFRNSEIFVSISAYSGSNTVQTNFTEFVGSGTPMLAVGGERIMELSPTGDLVSWGGNQSGEMGDYTFLDSTNPVHVVGLTNLVKIASGLNHSLAIDANGVVWAWGENGAGELGDSGSEASTNLPEQVTAISNAVAIAAHGFVNNSDPGLSLAAEADGTVWAWGTGDGYGIGGTPVQITGVSNVINVAAGAGHALALRNDGTVWAWGRNADGQLGDGTQDDSASPVQVIGLSNIAAICAGDYYSLALDTNGVVWAWGYNNEGLLGDGGIEAQSDVPILVTGVTNIIAIAAGSTHSLALDNSGRLWAWGNDSVGQLGDAGSVRSTNSPIPILQLSHIVALAAGSDASVALDSNGHVWQWGASDSDGINWNWGDENGYPMLAPIYSDFYNGQLPNLANNGGNNQTSYGSLEFAQPLVFQVKDTNNTVLTNAPVSVEVVAGDMELRTNTGGANFNGLRLTTDTNGEISLIGYAPPHVSNTNCIIRVLAASQEKIRELDFTETLVQPVYPTVVFTCTNMYLVRSDSSNSNVIIDGYAQDVYGSIQEVVFQIATNGGDYVPLGSTTQNPFSLTITNIPEGIYSIQAEAKDEIGLWSDPVSTNITVYLDADGNGLPDYWEIEYFGTNGLDPNSDPDGNGQSLLYDYQNGIDPTDYYDGNVPNLAIVSGTNQVGASNSFLPQPLVVQVTDANSNLLTNAPIVFTAMNDNEQLAATTNSPPASTLTLRTRSDGQVAAFVYFSSALGIDSQMRSVSATAWSSNSSVAVTFNEFTLGRLGYWRFDTTQWLGQENQVPLGATNLTIVPDWSGNALELDSGNPAYLTYAVIAPNGIPNIALGDGSIGFWFKPDWNSATADGGTGPGSMGRLIELGSQDSADGWWALVLSADGTTLDFITQTNGVGMTNLTATVSWNSNDWHQVVLTYSATNSALYVDGQALTTNGAGVVYWPDATALANGFFIGSDNSGNNQARGQFDELETFNYQMSSPELVANYDSSILLPPTVSVANTNGTCTVTLEQDEASEIVSHVTGFSYPNLISFVVADDYADSYFAENADFVDSRTEGINITKLPPPVITPSSGYFNYPSNIVISLSAENLTNLVAGLYQTELGRLGGSGELQTVIAYAQGLRSEGYSDEDIRSNLVNGLYLRGSVEYADEFGGPGDVYEANTNYIIEYSLDNAISWNTYTSPIQVTNSVTLQARVEKGGSSDNRTHYTYLASDVATAQFDYIPASWLTEYFGTDYQSDPNAAPDADPNNDGLSNLQEYQLGNNPTNAPLTRLGYWRFNTTEWLGEEGQVPLGFTNLASVPDWSGYALGVDTNLPAFLAYRIVETNGNANISCCNGSLRFWFQPNWSSSTTNNGTGPGSLARLIELGSQDSADGWWALVVSADGTTLDFITQTNGIGTTNLSATVNWASNDWHQVVLTYSTTNSALYLDGQAVVTNGAGVVYWPDATTLANGFYVGSNNAGNNQGRGQFDELETFNYPLSEGLVSSNYDLINPSGSGPVDYIGNLEGLNPLVHGATVPDINGIVNLQVYTPLH